MKFFLDTADISEMDRWKDRISGITTNPTLMRKARVQDYKSWAKIVLDKFPDKPVSLEVIADDFSEMERQARLLASWGSNVYVKIPITNTKGESSIPLIVKLYKEVNINITGVMTESQIDELERGTLFFSGIVSVFAGRIADTGRDPKHYVSYAARYGKPYEVLWASAREIYNVEEARYSGASIITLSPELIAKLSLTNKDLSEYSLETVRMFYDDAQKAGYTI